MAGSHEAPKKKKNAAERPAVRQKTRVKETRAPESRKQPPERSGKKKSSPGWFVPVMSALCVVLVLALAAGGFVLYVDNCDRIYPHVQLQSVDVGNMTPSAAMLVMEQQAPEGYAGKTVTVSLPMDEVLEVPAETLGLGGTRQTAVDAAYRYGRQGTILENALNYIRCLSGQGVNILWEGTQVDETALKSAVEERSVPLNAALNAATAELDGEELLVIKGAGSVQVDADEVCALVKSAFAERNYEPVKYEPGMDGSGGMDFQKLHDDIYSEPANASYDKENDEIVESRDGIDFDVAEAEKLAEKTIAGDVIRIPVQRTEPEITTDMMKENLFRDLLSSKATSMSGSSDARINNLVLAAAAMDGTVLLPGEEFSYNDCLGERTTDKGYQSAGAYANGRHTSAVGGGICQGSSTLYYCAIKANLEITERWDHYFAVSYLPMGMDATVSWYSPNFKFVNSRDYPIKISAWTENGDFCVEIWGTDVDGSYVDITSDGWEDAEFYYAQTYRNVYAADGTLISSEAEASSRYHKYEATDEE